MIRYVLTISMLILFSSCSSDDKSTSPSEKRPTPGLISKDAEKGMALPVVINVYKDRSFDFVIKSAPAAALLKKAAGIQKGSATPHTNKVAKVTRDQLADIVKAKEGDLTGANLENSIKIIAGTARSMGIEVED